MPSSPIALVQRAGKDAGTIASTTLAFPSANTAGNWIAVAVRAGGTNQVFTITDTRGNQYRKAVQFNVTLDNVTLAIFYAENISGGANTIQVSDSQSGTLRLAILEYSGVATTNSLDVTAAAQGHKRGTDERQCGDNGRRRPADRRHHDRRPRQCHRRYRLHAARRRAGHSQREARRRRPRADHRRICRGRSVTECQHQLGCRARGVQGQAVVGPGSSPAASSGMEPECRSERSAYFLFFSGTTCTSYNVLKSPS